jgi:hypothetical protein
MENRKEHVVFVDLNWNRWVMALELLVHSYGIPYTFESRPRVAQYLVLATGHALPAWTTLADTPWLLGKVINLLSCLKSHCSFFLKFYVITDWQLIIIHIYAYKVMFWLTNKMWNKTSQSTYLLLQILIIYVVRTFKIYSLQFWNVQYPTIIYIHHPV